MTLSKKHIYLFNLLAVCSSIFQSNCMSDPKYFAKVNIETPAQTDLSIPINAENSAYFTTPENPLVLVGDTVPSAPGRQLPHLLAERITRNERYNLIHSITMGKRITDCMAIVAGGIMLETAADMITLCVLDKMKESTPWNVVALNSLAFAGCVITGLIYAQSYKNKQKRLVELLHAIDDAHPNVIEAATTHPAYETSYHTMHGLEETDPLLVHQQQMSPQHQEFARNIAAVSEISSNQGKAVTSVAVGMLLMGSAIKDLVIFSDDNSKPTTTAIVGFASHIIAASAAFIVANCYDDAGCTKSKAHKEMLSQIDQLIIDEEQLNH